MSLIDSLPAGRLPSAAQGPASVRHSLLASKAPFQGRLKCARDAWRDISSVGERCWRPRLDSKPAALARFKSCRKLLSQFFRRKLLRSDEVQYSHSCQLLCTHRLLLIPIGGNWIDQGTYAS